MDASSPSFPHIDFNSDNLKLRLKMDIPADRERVTDVVDGIMAMVRTMDCACGQEANVELALQEALANAVVHGARGDREKMIQCRVACDDAHGMLVIVSDPGDGFDPAQVPDPLLAENLFSSHGRGIYLINRLMDHVEFKRGGAEIHMRKFNCDAGKSPSHCGDAFDTYPTR
jgi:serine/threonine-protein kinase RsbW